MKTIGLLGGISWQSTLSYYKTINTVVAQKLGGLHSAKCLLHSVDFYEIETRQQSGNWQECADILGSAALGLQNAGADFMVICANTMHKVADEIQAQLAVPVLHIAEVCADALLARGIKTAALLGTRYTMQQDFYTSRLQRRGLSVLLPGALQMEKINDIIFDELCRGIVTPASKQYYLEVIQTLAEQGAEGIILGCTEIGLLVQQADTAVPLFDTAEIHATRAALYALEG